MILIITVAWFLSEYTGSCKSVGTSTPLFPTLTENINVHLLNNICLPVHKEIHSSEITVNQGVTGTCTRACTHAHAHAHTHTHTHTHTHINMRILAVGM